MNTIVNKFALSRKDAADMLGISTRTLDRYIRSKKLSARKKGGAIVLSEEEVQNLKVSKFQNMHGASPEGPGRVHRHVDAASKTMPQTIFDAETGMIEELAQMPQAMAIASPSNSSREKVFEELYDLSRREVREYHNKLEATHYRLGQVEEKMRHSVPLLDYQKQTENLRDKEMLVEGKIKRQTETIDLLEQEMKAERFNKNIYIGLLFGLLALQPLLWLFLQS